MFRHFLQLGGISVIQTFVLVQLEARSGAGDRAFGQPGGPAGPRQLQQKEERQAQGRTRGLQNTV